MLKVEVEIEKNVRKPELSRKSFCLIREKEAAAVCTRKRKKVAINGEWLNANPAQGCGRRL